MKPASEGDEKQRAAAARQEPRDPVRKGSAQASPRRGLPEYGARHERVFQALTAAQEHHGGDAVHLEEISRAAGIPEEETRELLHELTQVHRLTTELAGSDRPDLGPRYETAPRL